jgi:negative regulator of sigma E activity
MPDEIEEYLSGDAALSREYRRSAAPLPPAALDRRVAALLPNQKKSLCLAPLAFAASVLLSVALVLAMIFGPQAAKRGDDAPHLVRVRAYGNEARTPAVWLADVAALRRAGRNREADEEMRRFHKVYPDYVTARGE